MRNFKILAAAIAALAAPVSAHAVLALQLSDGINPVVTVYDGGAGDAWAGTGTVTFLGAIGAWNINVSTGLGGTGTPSFVIDFNSVNVSTSLMPTTLTLQFTETDLTLSGYGSTPMQGLLGGTTNGTFSYALYADSNNTEFVHQQEVFSGGPLTGAFSATSSGLANLSGPFSLTQWVQITHPGGEFQKMTSFDFEADPVPEPGTLALLSLGLLGAGFVSRRRKIAGNRG